MATVRMACEEVAAGAARLEAAVAAEVEGEALAVAASSHLAAQAAVAAKAALAAPAVQAAAVASARSDR